MTASLNTDNAHDPTTSLPRLTTDLPAIGGVIKKYDEDFIVEEMPRYEAGGDGTHWYLTIEKQGLTTPAAIRQIARALGKRPSNMGYAGLKDAHGITRQRISVEHVSEADIKRLNFDNIDILKIERHTNKIKLGHLAGNRFFLRIRDFTSGTALAGAEAKLAVLADRGVPNYFGPQRFGARGDNAEVGLAVLREDFDEALRVMLGRPDDRDRNDVREARRLFDAGDYKQAAQAWPRRFHEQARVAATYAKSGDAFKAWRTVDQKLRRLYVSALQSALFNRLLAGRLPTFDQVQTGDVAWKHANGACFLVEDAATEQPRCGTFEISPSGPLFGRKMKEPQGPPADMEATVLQEAELTPAVFQPKAGLRFDGARRPLRVPLQGPAATEGRDDAGLYIELTFALPPGSYATCVTREIC